MRIGPNQVSEYTSHRVHASLIFSKQLHFNTPSAYNDIYVQGHRFTKDPRVYQAFQQDECSLCLIDLKEAKTRREILAPLFSRRAILKLEHVIQSKVSYSASVASTDSTRPPDCDYPGQQTSRGADLLCEDREAR